MDELVTHFLAEGRDLVLAASDDLDALRAAPSDAARLDGLFRTIHTLKGSTGLFDVQPMGDMLHAAEDLLAALRKGVRPLGPATIEILTRAVDQAGRWLDDFETARALPADAGPVGRRLQDQIRAELGVVPAAETSSVAPPAAWAEALVARSPSVSMDAALVAIRYVPQPDCFFTGDDPLALVQGVPGLAALSIAPREPWGAPETLDPFRCNLVIEALSAAPRAAVQTALRLVADQVEFVELQARARAVEAAPDQAGRTLRVDVDHIDALGRVAEELIVANNALAHLASEARGGLPAETLAQALQTAQTNLDRLVGSLHRAVARVRLVPLASLFRRFPRLVREIGERLGKDLVLGIDGDTIEVDKTLVDGLFEPLLHLVRNAADHGIEPAEARAAAGKPARGSIGLKASRIGDQVAIELTDDGRGIAADAIRRTARARGLMADEMLDALDDRAVLDLVFLPGFSTAAAVTELSGRGVGMDAVHAAVLKLGGRVTLASTPGVGTSVRLTLPVSVVLTGVVTVACGDERFGVPLDEVIETARVPAGRIVPVRNGRALVLRDTVVPVLDLADLLGRPAPLRTGEARLLIVRRADGVVAVAVDAFTGRMNLLLRPMDGLLAGMPGVAGTALLGDGRVLMVLDLVELIG